MPRNRSMDPDRGGKIPFAEGPLGPDQGGKIPFAEGPLGPDQGGKIPFTSGPDEGWKSSVK